MLATTLLIVGLAVLVLAFACRTFQSMPIRKMGLVAFMSASFVLFQALSGSWIRRLPRYRPVVLPAQG